MRTWLWTLAVLLVCAVGATPALAQAQLDCAALPETVCLNEEILALENERLALVAQISAADPQSTAAAGEQSWLDGLSACGDDVECYRTAYLKHNQTLRESALPGAAVTAPPLEAPEPTVEEQTSALDEVQAERLREARDEGGVAYVESDLPGWGFFTMIGVTLLIFWWLMRTLGRHRRELRAEEARLRDRWR